MRDRRADAGGADAGRGARLPRLETAVNLVFAEHDVDLLCPYDAGTLPAHLLDIGRHTHDSMRTNGAVSPNAGYGDPLAMLAGLSTVVPPPRDAITVDCSSPADVSEARRLVRLLGADLRLDRDTVDDVALAVTEVLTNALLHGSPPAMLHIYQSGPTWVCHVQDGGPDALDPLIGLLPPAMPTDHGYGLWLARQLCAAVDVGSDESGTHVRLHTRTSRLGDASLGGSGEVRGRDAPARRQTVSTTACESLGGGLDVVNETDQPLFIVERIPPDGGRWRYTINDCTDSDLEVTTKDGTVFAELTERWCPGQDVDGSREGRPHARRRVVTRAPVAPAYERPVVAVAGRARQPVGERPVANCSRLLSAVPPGLPGPSRHLPHLVAGTP